MPRPKPKAAAPPQREADVLKACLQLLSLRGVPAWRNNSGAFKVAGRLIRAGTKGGSDILAVIPFGAERGRLMALEVKRPGGKPTPDQLAFLARVRDAGGVALVVDDVAKLAEFLDGL